MACGPEPLQTSPILHAMTQATEKKWSQVPCLVCPVWTMLLLQFASRITSGVDETYFSPGHTMHLANSSHVLGNTRKQGKQKMEIQFFLLKIIAGKPVLAESQLYRGLQICQKLVDIKRCTEKTPNFHFLNSLFSGIAYVFCEFASV